MEYVVAYRVYFYIQSILFVPFEKIHGMYITEVFMKTLKASNFKDLSKPTPIVAEVAVKAPEMQSKSPPAQKPAQVRAAKKEPYARLSCTLTNEHVQFLDGLVQAQLNEGLNSNHSHVLRQLLTAEIKRNSK